MYSVMAFLLAECFDLPILWDALDKKGNVANNFVLFKEKRVLFNITVRYVREVSYRAMENM